MSLPALPVELWILILDIVMESGINIVDRCNHITFPGIDYALRNPLPRRLTDSSYLRLRLVCRAFNDLVKSPQSVWMRGPRNPIPNSARAVHIMTRIDPLDCLERLLSEPSHSCRISTLDMPCDIDGQSDGFSTLDYLCRNAHLLRGVRNLSLSVVCSRHTRLSSGFWMQINDSFPLLTCLVLRPSIRGVAIPPGPDTRIVTFENLRVLELNKVYLYHGLRFPVLRHVALGKCSQTTIGILAFSRDLESLLLRQLLNPEAINLQPLPNLRLLGIPLSGDGTVRLFPQYPLDHLSILICPHGRVPNLPHLVQIITSQLPRLSQISLDLTDAESLRTSIEDAFRREKPHVLPKIRVVISCFRMNSHLVVEPAITEPQVSSILASNGLRGRWTKILRAASRRLNL